MEALVTITKSANQRHVRTESARVTFLLLQWFVWLRGSVFWGTKSEGDACSNSAECKSGSCTDGTCAEGTQLTLPFYFRSWNVALRYSTEQPKQGGFIIVKVRFEQDWQCWPFSFCGKSYNIGAGTRRDRIAFFSLNYYLDKRYA